MQKLYIKKLHDDVILPSYATKGAAGLDIRAYLPKGEDSLVIPAKGRVAIPTGLAISLPIGFEVQVRARSGLAFKHGLMLTNGIGTIDSDYRGEVLVSLFNSSDTDFLVHHNDRIAQIVVMHYEQVEPVLADSLDATTRGEGGFGHTGDA